MRPRVLGVALVVVTLLAGGALAAPTDRPGDTALATTNASDGGPALGSKMSAFMHANSVAAESSVETGTWQVAVRQANSSAQVRMIEQRTARLEERLRRVQARLATLDNRSVRTGGPAAASDAAGLLAQASSLKESINETDRIAERVGVNDSRLNRLRSQAANLTGPEVAAIARSLSLGPPGDVPRGPPGNVSAGPPENKTVGPPANVTTGPTANRTAGPSGVGTAGSRANGTTGPPDDVRTGKETDRTTGSPNNETTGKKGDSAVVSQNP